MNFTKNIILNELSNENENKETKIDYEISISDKKELINLDNNNYNKNVQNRLNTKKVKIINIEELRQNNINGSTLKVVFDLTGSDLKYKPAENILVYPQNIEEAINTVLNQLISDKGNNFVNYKISNKDNLNLPLPEGITVKEALTEYIDLSCQITKNMLSKLVNNNNDFHQHHGIKKIINTKKN